MVWGNLMSASTFINLWVNEFFPKWLKILVAWLQNSPNYEEITQWYLGWKQFFPPEMQSHPLIQQQFTKYFFLSFFYSSLFLFFLFFFFLFLFFFQERN